MSNNTQMNALMEAFSLLVETVGLPCCCEAYYKCTVCRLTDDREKLFLDALNDIIDNRIIEMQNKRENND